MSDIDDVLFGRLTRLLDQARQLLRTPERDQLDAAIRDSRPWSFDFFDQEGTPWLRLYVDGKPILAIRVDDLDPDDLLERRRDEP